MEEFIKSDLDFEDMELSVLVNSLKNVFDKRQDNFVYLCKDIYRIWKYCKKSFYKAKDNEYYNSYKLLAKFGFDKKAVNRYVQCYTKFVVDNNVTTALVLCFKDFSPSKLYELLPLSKEMAMDLAFKQIIKPTMTVKQIREYIKILKDGSDKAEKVVEVANNDYNEEDIPMAFDPKKEYDFEYFNRKTKNELVSICVSYQDYLKKLKSKKK